MISNQVIRGDLEFVKVSDDLNGWQMSHFPLPKTTGESHNIVTDKNVSCQYLLRME